MPDQDPGADSAATHPTALEAAHLGQRPPELKSIVKREDTRGVTAILLSVVLARTLGSRLMRQLKDPNIPLLLCLEVPDRNWFEPLREAAKDMRVMPMVYTWDVTARRGMGDPSVNEIVCALANGRAVLCVSQDVATAVPQALRTVADATVSLSAPVAADIAFAIKLVRGGRVPSRVPLDLGAGLELLEIAACLRHDDPPRVMVDRIRRAMTAKRRKGVDHTVPRLEDLHGYGEAAVWGRRVVADVAAFRGGRLTWRDVTGPAVLHGPPGTGKTLFGRVLARSLEAPIVATSVSNWFQVGTGDLGATIRTASAAFDEARALVRDGGVCVLFLDEIDSLPDRAALDAREGSWWRPVVNHVLTLIDGATSNLERIVLLAATNDLRAVDRALLRPGRLGTTIEVLAPATEDLAAVVRHHLGGEACPLAQADMIEVLRPLSGATQARAAGWAAEALRRAREMSRPVTLDDLVAVVRPPDLRPAAVRWRIAVHEAGHAVAAWHLAQERLVAASIVERSDYHGTTTMVARDEALLARADIEDEVVIVLSGRAADVIVGDGANAGAGGTGHAAASSDLAVATRLLTAVHASFGLGLTLRHRGDVSVGGIRDTNGEVAALVEADLQRLMSVAEQATTIRATEVRAVAQALVDRGFLTKTDVGAVVSAV